MFPFGFAGAVRAAFGIGGAFEVRWLAERRSVGLVTCCKCSSIFFVVGGVVLCLLGAAKNEHGSVRVWRRWRAGEESARVHLGWGPVQERSVLTDATLRCVDWCVVSLCGGGFLVCFQPTKRNLVNAAFIHLADGLWRFSCCGWLRTRGSLQVKLRHGGWRLFGGGRGRVWEVRAGVLKLA